jgi:hypothetical protein
METERGLSVCRPLKSVPTITRRSEEQILVVAAMVQITIALLECVHSSLGRIDHGLSYHAIDGYPGVADLWGKIVA